MNEHLRDYLAYYQTCNAPGYAVLVTGAWGIGKTFQVKNLLTESQRHYISLFGLQTTDEVHAEVAVSMDPNLSKLKKLLKAGSDVGNAAPGPWKMTGAAGGMINSLIKTRTDNTKTIIFDDLERCSLDIKDTLGVINQYVEHYGCRVIVLAHDEKLAAEFIEAKEKLFGQTIQIEPQIADAFTAFCEQQKSSARKKFLKDNKEAILNAFGQSKTQSLRILKHVVEDTGRLFDVLGTKYLAKPQAISELVELFVAIDIECRNGLTEADLRDRRQVVYRHGTATNNPPVPPFVLAKRKYETIDISSELLNDDLLVEMFIKGVFSQKSISKALDNSVHFAAPADLPAWIKVLKFDQLEDFVVAAAQADMDKAFSDFYYTHPGEILHVFALKLMMAENGVTDKTIEKAKEECKAYIAGVLASGHLLPRPNDWDWDRGFTHGYSGYGYWITTATEPHFIELFDALNEARSQAAAVLYPDMVKDILSTLEKDGEALYHDLNTTVRGKGKYAFRPVLHLIPVKDFFATWMKSPKSNWHHISTALRQREEGAIRHIGLDAEFAWYRDLKDLMEDEANKLGGFEALRLRRAIPRQTP
ncbi:P-loop NTPase fold protein [Asticcacaulis sp.]|uniref:P-loop NTPase fold protein n=1 Tax=Asticcacaulis sp. TaxID=1872648 RepID=UPI003F7C56F9